MEIKKWENPEIISLNSKETKECEVPIDEPHYWHCTTHGKLTVADIIYEDGIVLCATCRKEVIHVGCGPHPS